ncbi:unnamed protein product [Brassica oleracea]
MADGNENQAPEKLQGKFQAKVICCILGIGGLASWNSLLTIADYYYKVFPDYHPSRVLVLVYQPFALGTIVILAYHGNLDLTTRGRGGVGPYIGLCAIVASFGLADATVQGGMIGDLSLMCPELIQSFMAGLGVAGALTSAFRLMTKAAFENSNDGLRKGAMIFLAISAFIQFLCVMLYAYVFPKLPIVKYYRRKAASEGSKTVTADLVAAGIKKSIIFWFLYENTGQHGLGSWYALVLVAMYNSGNMVRRYTPLVEWLKIENRKGLTLVVFSRFLFIPAFYFTAKYGDQGWMIMLVSLLGLTTGHFNVCILITAPKGYNKIWFYFCEGPEKNALGNLLVVFLTGGIVAGTSLGRLWLIGKKNAF